MRYPALTIASVLALAYVMNASGMTACLGIWFTRAGRLFPFLSPILGWLGVFLTGSDTSSNVLFGGLQKSAATQLGINPILTAAGNTSGGVMGKMISPQSLAVACAATGTVGDEGRLLRFTLKHSLLLLLFVCGHRLPAGVLSDLDDPRLSGPDWKIRQRVRRSKISESGGGPASRSRVWRCIAPRAPATIARPVRPAKTSHPRAQPIP